MKSIALVVMASLFSLTIINCEKNADKLWVEQEEYASKINTKLDQVEMEISHLKTELASQRDTLGEATDSTITVMEVELEHRITQLEQEKAKLNEQFQRIWQTNNEEWEVLKTRIDEQLADVQEYLDKELAVSLK